MINKKIRVSAPGRVCIFGEHQDYFGLPIIAAAINLRISIVGKKREDKKFIVNLPDIEDTEEFSLAKEVNYTKKRDYLKSAVNVLQRKGVTFSSGWDCLVQGKIPINSGTASSSALVVAWIKFLLETAGDKRAKIADKIAELAFLSEVAEFKEPGGKMDHFTSSLGGVISIHFGDKLKVRKLKNPLKEFVLADSLQKKDTTGMLGYIKKHVLDGVASVQKMIKGFSLVSSITQEEKEKIEKLPPDEKRLLKGTLLTRDLAVEGESLFESEVFDHKRFGQLLSKQHEVLRDYLQISTPKIEQMIEVSLKAGALGAKTNGSGGGGCMFAYTCEKSENVAEALEKTGAKVYIVRVGDGVRKES
ncbi:MAG: galactokinase family protein [Candidatus Aminicenantaceae bacterium]